MTRSPRKILMTTDAVGGVWTYALELCKALPSINFLLANMGPPPSLDKRCEIAEIENVEMIESSYQLEWAADPWRDLDRAGRWLLELEARFHPDVIHLNGYVHASLPWLAPTLIVAHSCVISWWKAVKGGAPPEEWDRYAAAVAEGLNACDQVVVPSRAMGEALMDHYGISEPQVIPNGCQMSCYVSSPMKEPIVLCAARLWDEAKNVKMLANAAADLPWTLVFAGDAGDGELSFPNVCIAGHCSRPVMSRWFQRAAIYAHPALYEPFGLAPLEAAHAGCALVLADIPSLREIWEDAAEFVAPGDANAWRATLEYLISDTTARRELAENAGARAKQYSPHLMAIAYLNVYQNLLQSAKPHLTHIL